MGDAPTPCALAQLTGDETTTLGGSTRFTLVTATDRATNLTEQPFSVVRDTTPPTLTLNPAVESGALRVTWSSSDAASGVDASTCELHVQEDEGAWQPFSTACAGDEVHGEAQPGHVYTFRLSASDNVSNAASTEALVRFPRVTKYYYHGSTRVAMRADGVVYYLHTDHLGSTSLVTSQTSEVVSRQLYHPYGTVRWQDGTLPTDFGFTGQRRDSGTGLIFMHARYYHAGLGRFVSADTVVPEPGNPQSLNRFSYVAGNPLLYVDPTGHIFGLPLLPLGSHINVDISGWDPQVVQALDVAQETARTVAKLPPVLAGPSAVAKNFLKYVEVDSEEGTLMVGRSEPWSATEVALQIAGLTAVIGAPASSGLGQALDDLGEVANPVPTRLARVVPAQYAESPTLAAPGTHEAFATAADDIAGITTSRGLAERLTLVDEAGNLIEGPFAVFEFDAPASGVASPVFRSNPGFIGGGLTAGGAREFVIPNLQLSELENLVTRIVR